MKPKSDPVEIGHYTNTKYALYLENYQIRNMMYGENQTITN